MENKEAKKLKDLFDKNLAEKLANEVLKVQASFDRQNFIKTIDKKVGKLELKDRTEVFADELHYNLRSNYRKGIKVLLKTLGPENKEETGMFTNFYWVMPIAKYVEKYGLEDFEVSMLAIEEITKRNTGEYAIRPFLEQNRKRTLKQMKIWSTSKNSHVRRLACEGLRPRLPWANKLDIFIEQPKYIVPVLNNLKDDESKYVQKSVANCLSDILKDNYEFGKKLIEEWNTKKASEACQWIIKHALRNQIKKKDKWAMAQVKA